MHFMSSLGKRQRGQAIEMWTAIAHTSSSKVPWVFCCWAYQHAISFLLLHKLLSYLSSCCSDCVTIDGKLYTPNVSHCERELHSKHWEKNSIDIKKYCETKIMASHKLVIIPQTELESAWNQYFLLLCRCVQIHDHTFCCWNGSHCSSRSWSSNWISINNF